MADRAETVRVVHAMMTGRTFFTEDDDETEPETTNKASQSCRKACHVFGPGPLLLSDIPASCRHNTTTTSSSSTTTTKQPSGVMVGIDEAGRGSVLGPMVYGMAYWNGAEAVAAAKIPKDFQDSKQLTESKRSQLFQTILQTPAMGFGVRVLPASEISRNMLRPEPYNLNQMSHDAAIQLIRQLQVALAKDGNSNTMSHIDTCFIDTVGNPESYKRRLQAEFPGIQFVVESKADAKYAVCSAASVVAKVMRDALLEHWKFSEPPLQKEQQAQAEGATTTALSTSFGSGYPSDPICKKWMDENLRCKVFGYPDIVRFSWGPAKKALQKDAYDVKFLADDEDHEDNEHGNSEFVLKKRQQEQMSIFLGKAPATPRKRKRYPFFEKRGLDIVTKLG